MCSLQVWLVWTRLVPLNVTVIPPPPALSAIRAAASGNASEVENSTVLKPRCRMAAAASNLCNSQQSASQIQAVGLPYAVRLRLLHTSALRLPRESWKSFRTRNCNRIRPCASVCGGTGALCCIPPFVEMEGTPVMMMMLTCWYAGMLRAQTMW